MPFHRITISPFFTNALDLIGRTDLVTSSGLPVTIKRNGMDFEIIIGEGQEIKRFLTDDNLVASFYLNLAEIGIHE